MRGLPTSLIKGLQGVVRRSKGRQNQTDDDAAPGPTKTTTRAKKKKMPASKPAEDTAESTRRWRRLFRPRRPMMRQSTYNHGSAPQATPKKKKKLPISPAAKAHTELKVDVDNHEGGAMQGAIQYKDEADRVLHNTSQQQQPQRSDSHSGSPSSCVSTSEIAATRREKEHQQCPDAPREHAAHTQLLLSCDTDLQQLSPPLLLTAEPKPPLPSLEPTIQRPSAPVETALLMPPPQSPKPTLAKPPSPSLKPAVLKPPLPSLNAAVQKQILPPSETALQKPKPPPPSSSHEFAVQKLAQLPFETDRNKPPPPSLEAAMCTPSFETARHQLAVTPELHQRNALPARSDDIVSHERPACAVKTIVHEHRASTSVPKYKSKLADDVDESAPLMRSSNKAIFVEADKEKVTAYVCGGSEKHGAGDDYALNQLIGTSKKFIRNHNSSVGREPLRTRADLTIDTAASNTLSGHSAQSTKLRISSNQKEQALDQFAIKDKACTNERPVDIGVNSRVRDTTIVKRGACESKRPPQRTDETRVEEPSVGVRKHKESEKPTNREANATKPGTRDTGWKKREQESKEPIWVIEARMREAFVEQSSRVHAPQQPPLVPRQPRHPPPCQPSRPPTRPPGSPVRPIERPALRPVNRDAPYPDSATPTPEKKGTVSTPSPASSTRRGRRASPDAPEPPPQVQALLAAAENGDLPTLASMLETVDVDARDPYDGYSALTIASEEGRLEIVQYLVRHGANFHQRDSVGRTALFAAAVADKARVVTYLVDKGADPRIVDNEGRSVFWACCAVHASDAAVALLDAAKAKGVRIDIDARDPCGLSAVEFAAHRGHADILQLLRQRGAKEDFKKPGKGRLVIND